MGVMKDFYILCDVLDDDLDLVAELIHVHYPIKTKLSAIKADIQDATEIENCGADRLKKYRTAINKALDMPHAYIKLFKAKHQAKGLFD